LPIIDEHFGTIMYWYVQFLAEKLIVGRLVPILKPSPSAYVIHEDRTIVTISINDVPEKSRQACAMAQRQSTSSVVKIGTYNGKTHPSGVLEDGSFL
jgi:hypothetical protein